VVNVTARNGIGGFRYLKIGRRNARVKLTLKRPRLDRKRSVSAVFQPGQVFLLSAKDRRNVTYTLVLPGNALAKPSKITMTPLRSAVTTGRASGAGIELGPSGLKLANPGLLVLSGERGGNHLLLTYSPRTGAFNPLVSSFPGQGPRRFTIQHFSTYGSSDLSGFAASAASAFAAQSGEKNDAMEWIGEQAAAAGQSIEDFLDGLDPSAKNELILAWHARFGDLDKFARKNADKACLTRDKSTLALALFAIAVAHGFDAISKDESATLRNQLIVRCANAFTNFGNEDCRQAEASQNGPDRQYARDEYLRFAKFLLSSIGVTSSTVEAAIRQCTGYSVHAHFRTEGDDPSTIGHYVVTFDADPFTCADVYKGQPWTGTATWVFDYENGGRNGDSRPMAFSFNGSQDFDWHPREARGDGGTRLFEGTASPPSEISFRYESRDPDGSASEGPLEAKGFIVPGVDPGHCGV
jgi:hypothetical protein